MSIVPEILFDKPQQEIATLILSRMRNASSISVVTGFATPGGLEAIDGPIRERPSALAALVVGAATYPGFEAMDDLIAAGVSLDRLYVHLGHTSANPGKKHPYARYRPMLHSKVYYMELANSRACAFIGSHNLTAYALTGLNGEASIMLEGPINAQEFDQVRAHIAEAQRQATRYEPEMKEAYARWMREYVEGLQAEIAIPSEWQIVRTILLFVKAGKSDRPKPGEHLYFEIPAGIEQIVSLETETHLFLFETLPPDPYQALASALSADASYECKTLGAENEQGNLELAADWRVDGATPPILRRIPEGRLRPATRDGMQQVRGRIDSLGVKPYDYKFDRDRTQWSPKLSEEKIRAALPPTTADQPMGSEAGRALAVKARDIRGLEEKRQTGKFPREWSLVKGFVRREGSPREKDELPLLRAAPESGSFTLVSLRRARKDRARRKDTETEG